MNDIVTQKTGGGSLYRRRLSRQVSMHTLIGFNELRLNVQLCDATLILDDGSTFPIHRSIVSGSSNYFRILFTTTLNEGEHRNITMKGIDSPTMEMILQYIYIRQIDLNYDNVFEIMRTADYLGIDGLVQLCQEYVIDCMGTDNCVRVLQYADDFNFGALANAAYNYIVKYFTTIAQQDDDELMKLSKEDFRRIIENDQLNVKREEFVWDIILKWVSYCPTRQKTDLVYLLPGVRFGLMESKYFIDNVKDHRYIKNRLDCKPYIIDVLQCMYDLHLNKPNPPTDALTPKLTRPRYPFEVLFAIGGWSGDSPTSIIETYDIRTDRWVQIFREDPQGPRAYHGTVVMNHYIYVVGGFDGMEYFNSCKKFNTITKTWEEVAPMNSKRCYVSVALLNGTLYAMGGYDGVRRLGTAEKYDIERNQWTIIAPMTTPRSDACATVLDNEIYIVGGFDGQECMNTAEKYDTDADQWTQITPMQTRRSGVSCTAYHGCLYAVGGFNGLTRMKSGEKYDPADDRWKPVAEMAYPRSNFALCVLDDLLFAAGGFNGHSPIAQVERYDGRTDKWHEVSSMQVYRSALSACVMTDLADIESYVPLSFVSTEESRRNNAAECRNDGGGGGRPGYAGAGAANPQVADHEDTFAGFRSRPVYTTFRSSPRRFHTINLREVFEDFDDAVGGGVARVRPFNFRATELHHRRPRGI